MLHLDPGVLLELVDEFLRQELVVGGDVQRIALGPGRPRPDNVGGRQRASAEELKRGPSIDQSHFFAFPFVTNRSVVLVIRFAVYGWRPPRSNSAKPSAHSIIPE